MNFGLTDGVAPVGSMLPVDTFKRFRPRKPTGFDDMTLWLESLAKKYIDFDPSARNQRHHQMFLAQEFWQSRQYGFFEGDSWLNPDPNKDGVYYQCDYFSEQVQAQLAQWCATNIEYIVTAAENDSQGQLAAKFGTDILGHYTREFDNPIEEQLLGLSAILKGTYLLYTFFDAESDRDGRVQFPVYKQQESPNPDQRFQCMAANCGRVGMLTELNQRIKAEGGIDDDTLNEILEGPQGEGQEQQSGMMDADDHGCPACGKPIQIFGPPTITKVYVDRVEDVPVGEIKSIQVPAEQIEIAQSVRGAKVHESPYLIWDRRILKSALESTYWYLDSIPANVPTQGNRYIRTLERQVGSFIGASTGVNYGGGTLYQEDTCNFTQVWLDICLYKNAFFEKATAFQNGVNVPAGATLGEVFPDGIYLALINRKIVDIRNENKNNHWVGGVWKVVPGAAYGLGVQSALWQQRLLNDAYNMGVGALRHLANPQRFYNANVFDGGHLAANPENIIPVINLGPDGDLSKIFWQAPAPGINSAIPQFIQQARSDMQAGTFTNPALLGQSNPNISATDAKQSKDQAVQTAGLPMQIKAWVKAKRGEQILKLFRKHCFLIRNLAVPVQSDYQRIEMKKFSAMDINTDLFVTYAEHSAVPRTAGDRRNDVLNARAAGVWDESVQPKVRRLMANVFQVAYMADEPGQELRKAEERFIDIQKQVIKFRAFAKLDPQGAQLMLLPEPPPPPNPLMPIMPPDPTPVVIKQILGVVAIDLEFDDHEAQQVWIKDWWNSDRGNAKAVDPLLRAVMKARFHEHRDAALQVKQSQSADFTLANAPQMAAAAQAGQGLGGAALPVKSHLDPQGSLIPQQQ